MTVADKSMQMKLYQWQVTGRARPTEKNPEPTIYQMRIFARDEIVAASRFWYFMKSLKRVKKTAGEVLEIVKIEETNPDVVKNYGVWLRYDSRTGTHNMYKEYRDVTPEGAVGQMYCEMAGRHRAQSCSIQVIKVEVIEDESAIRRPHMLQLLPADLKFPNIRMRPMVPKDRRKTFSSVRPVTFAH